MGVEVRPQDQRDCSRRADFIELGCDEGAKTRDETTRRSSGPPAPSAPISPKIQPISNKSDADAPDGRLPAGREAGECFVAGDNRLLHSRGQNAPVPQMVENCEHSAKNNAQNIEYHWLPAKATSSPTTAFPWCHGVDRRRYGVAYVGTDKKKFSLPSFLAMFTKHLINMVYFLQLLAGTRSSATFATNSSTLRNCRSFVGGHFLQPHTQLPAGAAAGLFLGFMCSTRA
jgi:NADH dehydrogenase